MSQAFAQLKTVAKTGWLKCRVAGNLSAMLSQEEIQNALKAVKYPGYSRDIISFGLVKEINAANGAVSVAATWTPVTGAEMRSPSNWSPTNCTRCSAAAVG